MEEKAHQWQSNVETASTGHEFFYHLFSGLRKHLRACLRQHTAAVHWCSAGAGWMATRGAPPPALLPDLCHDITARVAAAYTLARGKKSQPKGLFSTVHLLPAQSNRPDGTCIAGA